MIDQMLAGRYAGAMVALASEKGVLDRVHAEIELLADILMPDRGEVQVPELLDLLAMPRVPLEEKIRITDLMLEQLDFSEEVGNLLNVLIARRRVGLMGKIADQFRARLAEAKSVAVATAETAKPMSEHNRQALKSALKVLTGREVDLAVYENPALLGGLRVHVDGRLLDGSVDGALTRLETGLAR
jgi:F-type H+-transporting ATPase subunit delta